MCIHNLDAKSWLTQATCGGPEAAKSYESGKAATSVSRAVRRPVLVVATEKNLKNFSMMPLCYVVFLIFTAGWDDDEPMEEARDDRDRVLGNRMEGPPVPVVDFPPEGEEEAEMSDAETIVLVEDEADTMDQSSLQERVAHVCKPIITEVVSLDASNPSVDVVTIDWKRFFLYFKSQETSLY